MSEENKNEMEQQKDAVETMQEDVTEKTLYRIHSFSCRSNFDSRGIFLRGMDE